VTNIDRIRHASSVWRGIAEAKRLKLRVFDCCKSGVNKCRGAGFARELKWDVDLLRSHDVEAERLDES